MKNRHKNISRGACLLVAGLAAVAWLGVLYVFLILLNNADVDYFSDLLLGVSRNTQGLWPFPFTVQVVMWLIFFLGLGDLYFRYRSSRQEEALLNQHILPEDQTVVLVAEDVGHLYRKMRESFFLHDQAFLYRLVQRIIFQFQSSRSVDQASGLLNSSLELFYHEVDLHYNLLRYVVWLIPTLGFMGTVIGINLALVYAGGADMQAPDLLSELSIRLAVAFNTTLIALILSAILVLLMHIVQEREERALNHIGQYCLDNLVNRLYVAERD